MKTGIMVALLLLALVLSGCPHGGRDGTVGQTGNAAGDQAQSAGGASADATQVHTPEPKPPAADETESAPAQDAEQAADSPEQGNSTSQDDTASPDGEGNAESNTEGSALELDGLRLGISPDSYRVYYNSRTSATMSPTWSKDEQTGVIETNLADDSRYFNEMAYFLDSELVGVMRDRQESAGEYADFTNELERRYGPPGEKPPRWAIVTAFFFGYQPPGEGVIMKFWGNSHMRQVLYAARSNEKGVTSYVLCDADRFDAVVQAMQTQPPPAQ